MTWIAILILLAYTVALTWIGGRIPSSLSASVYSLPRNLRWIWCVVIGAVCFCFAPPYIARTGEDTRFLAFFAVASLLFVAAAPLIPKDENGLQRSVHNVGATVCAISSQTVLVFNSPWLLLCWIPFAAFGIWKLIRRESWRTMLFWGEAVCFVSTFVYCLN